MYVARVRQRAAAGLMRYCHSLSMPAPALTNRARRRASVSRKEIAIVTNRYYELVFIGRQDLSNAQVDNLIEQVRNLVTEQGGSVHKTENWGLRQFAYRMKKNRKGHYVLLNIELPGNAVETLKDNLNFNEDVLRHLLVRVDELDDQPSPMMQGRKDEKRRDGRSRRGGEKRGESQKATAEQGA